MTQHPCSHLSVQRSVSDVAITVVACALLSVVVVLPPLLVVILGAAAGYTIGLLRSGAV